jgi:hypothetical protein
MPRRKFISGVSDRGSDIVDAWTRQLDRPHPPRRPPQLPYIIAIRVRRGNYPFRVTQLNTPCASVSGPPEIAGMRGVIGRAGLRAWPNAMTLRTGKSGRYKYYTCSTKAREGETCCKGHTVPMEKLDSVVAEHIEQRLLQPKRLEQILSAVLHRRKERAERRTAHIAELRKRPKRKPSSSGSTTPSKTESPTSPIRCSRSA